MKTIYNSIVGLYYLCLLTTWTWRCCLCIECVNGKVYELFAPYDQVDDPVYITSPDYPNYYPPNVICGFYFKTEEKNQIVSVLVNDIAIGNPGSCAYDKLLAFDGPTNTSKLLGSSCFNKVRFQSSGNYMYVQFQSDSYVSSRGFKAKYYALLHEDNFKLSGGAIAGICLAVIVFVICAIVFTFWGSVKRLYKRCCRKNQSSDDQLPSRTFSSFHTLEENRRNDLRPTSFSTGQLSNHQLTLAPPPYESVDYSADLPPPPSYDEVMFDSYSYSTSEQPPAASPGPIYK
ncbi:hypothetical protein SNE40_006319 [Patella caerulea]|uniref:CUB domain-containing protein n=1 Tax=Patella caerulea TaxID=87958 RepID=A0AAN8K0R5_PATCE